MKNHQLIVYGIIAIAIPLFFIGKLPERPEKEVAISTPQKLTPPAEHNPFTQAMLADFASQLQKEFEQTHTPGAAVVIVKDSSIIYMRGLGLRANGTSDSVDMHTIFRLGSVSKGFAAVLTGLLANEGQLNWNDQVIKYDPNFRLKSTEQTDKLAIENLLSHTTGLPYHAYTNLVEEDMPLNEMLERLSDVDLIARVGKVYSYQNVAYSEISNVLKGATGKNYDELLEEKIFGPLHMDNASVTYRDFLNNPNTAKPHVYYRGGWHKSDVSDTYYNVAPAGGVNASINDMSKWLKAMMGNTSGVIPNSTLHDVFNPFVRTNIRKHYYLTSAAYRREYYGMGWRISLNNSDTIIYHGGYVNQFRSEIAFDKNEHIGICILTNAPTGLASKAVATFFKIYRQHMDSIEVWDDELMALNNEEDANAPALD